MLERLLPRTADNTYRGYKIALWIYGVVVLWKMAIAAATIFNGRNTAIAADGIPVNSFSQIGAQDFLSLQAALGVALFILCAIAALVFFRYRALVPLMFVVLLLENLLRRLVYFLIPMIRVGSPVGTWVNVALITLMLVGLILSLLPARVRPQEA